MTPESQLRERLQPLLIATTDGQLTDVAREELRAALRNDPAAQAYYARYMFVHGALAWRESEPMPGAGVPAEAEDGVVSPERRARWWSPVVDTINRNSTASMLVSGLFITTILLLLALWTLPAIKKTISPEEAATTFVAQITDTHEATWHESSDGNYKNIDLFADERLVLNEGFAEVTFGDGAVVLLEAPVELSIDSSREGTLDIGKLSARVPPQAKGFSVVTPRAIITDLGTEFGVDVTVEGDTHVEVLTGIVECESLTTAGPRKAVTLSAGESARVGEGSQITVGTFRKSKFVRDIHLVPSSKITFIDAVPGDRGNTFATGRSPEDLRWLHPEAISDDVEDRWVKRPFGNGSILQAKHNLDDGDDIPQLTTRINGLGEGRYEVWVFFWVANEHDWSVSAALNPNELKSYGRSNTHETGAAKSAVSDAAALDFTRQIVLEDTGRTLYGARLGGSMVSADKALDVFVDNRLGKGAKHRTWYDGVGLRRLSDITTAPDR